MPYEFKAIRRVEFSDTDMAGIMHYSNYFRFMETAEHAFFRSLGLSIVSSPSDAPVGWPRVRAECDFTLPLYFEDEVEIHLLVREKRSKSLSYIFKFRRLNDSPPRNVAQGAVTAVCVTHQPDGKMRACSIPKSLSDRIQVAPPEMLASRAGGGLR